MAKFIFLFFVFLVVALATALPHDPNKKDGGEGHAHEHAHAHAHDHEHAHGHEHGSHVKDALHQQDAHKHDEQKKDEHKKDEHKHAEHDEHVHVVVPKLELNDKNHIPAIGLGTSVKGGSKHNEVQLAVEAGIDAGYRHIDTAENYDTEDQVGLAIRNKIQEKKVRREDLFITTKLWNDHHRPDLVVPALKESLHKLGVDYVDLYLIHWPVEDFKNFTFGETDYMDTWKAMEECKKLGLAKSIGVSNFNEKQIARIIKEGHVKPAALQIEVNPNLTQKKLVKYAHDNGIVVIAYAPLGSLPSAKQSAKSPPPSIDDPKLTAMGQKYHKNTVQVVLRYLIERGVIPIPKSGNPKRLKENIDIFDFTLTPEEVDQIDHFNKDFRLIDVPEWRSHKYYPFGA